MFHIVSFNLNKDCGGKSCCKNICSISAQISAFAEMIWLKSGSTNRAIELERQTACRVESISSVETGHMSAYCHSL